MRNWIEHWTMATVATVVLVALLSTPSHALNKCSANIRASDGVILVNAARVTGPLKWGTAAGAESNDFANAATCLKGKAAVGCQLGAAGTAEQITPPQLCSLFLSDGTESCTAHIRGCTPGVRTPVPGPQGPEGPTGPQGETGPVGPTGPSPLISYVTCTGPSSSGGSASSSCTATCPANTKVVGGGCSNNTATPQFAQGQIADPGTNTTWSCMVKNSNSFTGAISAQGTAICLPQS